MARPHKRTDGIPTRCDRSLMSPAELAISSAMAVVEAAGGSTALTDAVNLLSKARDRVADHVETVVPLPQYVSHKVVGALKIRDVDGCTIIPADPEFPAFVVLPEMYLRYTPTAGDYFVEYADGYQAFSPAKAFEEGYARVEQA